MCTDRTNDALVEFFLPAKRVNKGFNVHRCHNNPKYRMDVKASNNPINYQTNVQYELRYLALIQEAFGIRREEYWSNVKYDKQSGSHGVRIVCRPDQFTRFIIWRRQAGLQNWLSDFQVRLIPSRTSLLDDFYDKVAKDTSYPLGAVKNILTAAHKLALNVPDPTILDVVDR
jgi:hypothetical protein